LRTEPFSTSGGTKYLRISIAYPSDSYGITGCDGKAVWFPINRSRQICIRGVHGCGYALPFATLRHIAVCLKCYGSTDVGAKVSQILKVHALERLSKRLHLLVR
jgi:hypothetical protein